MVADRQPRNDAEAKIRDAAVDELCRTLTDGDLLRCLNRRGRLYIAECNRVYSPDTNRSNFPAYLKFIDGTLAKMLGLHLMKENLIRVGNQTDYPMLGPTGEKSLVRQISVVVVTPPKEKTDDGRKTQG